jgi:hypothetical protein
MGPPEINLAETLGYAKSHVDLDGYWPKSP